MKTNGGGEPVVRTDYQPAAVRYSAGSLVVDCDRCTMQGVACHDCVVSVLIDPNETTFSPDEIRAVTALATWGLVPPLRAEGGR